MEFEFLLLAVEDGVLRFVPDGGNGGAVVLLALLALLLALDLALESVAHFLVQFRDGLDSRPLQFVLDEVAEGVLARFNLFAHFGLVNVHVAHCNVAL